MILNEDHNIIEEGERRDDISTELAIAMPGR